jgi:hypothetical protein
MEVYVITAKQETSPAPVESNTKQPRSVAVKSVAKRKAAASKGKPAPSPGKPSTSPGKPAQKARPVTRAPSKQDRVVAMLQRTEGTTVAAVMKATGWQKHSVHGFFAGVVRKKLSLNLVSAETDGKRVYRVVGAKAAGKTGSKPGKRPSTNSPARKKAAA